MLDGDAASEGHCPSNVPIRNRLRMIEEPVQPIEWDVAVHFLKNIQESLNGLVIGGVQTERPALLGE